MKPRKLSAPPATPRDLRRQREIVGAIITSASLAYLSLIVVIIVIARPFERAVISGSTLMIGIYALGFLFLYFAIGGILCASYAGQLNDWPPPGPDCDFSGSQFVRAWIWSAARILVQLTGKQVRRGA